VARSYIENWEWMNCLFIFLFIIYK
jgi:hypothetical protein